MQKGFTLVELAIVLVIIGLIISGVLVGRDMIKAAEIRSTIGQVEKYQAAINVFRNKYNGLPGDLANATNFGFQTRTGADGHGDNDGLIEYCSGVQSTLKQGCETVLFWRDLSEAGLIPESFSTATDADAAVMVGVPGIPLSQWYPIAKIGKNNAFVVFNSSTATFLAPYANYFYLGSMLRTASGQPLPTYAYVTPAEAYGIDSKMDDGKPQSGTVVGGTNNVTAFNIAAGTGATVCASAADTYNLDPAYADTQICVMNIKM